MLIKVSCYRYPIDRKVFEDDSEQREAFLEELKVAQIEVGRLEMWKKIPPNFEIKDTVSERAIDVLTSLLMLIAVQLSYSKTAESWGQIVAGTGILFSFMLIWAN
jgi:hypothetical protein